MKDIKIISATQQKNKEQGPHSIINPEDLLRVQQSFDHHSKHYSKLPCDLQVEYNNTEPLAKVYNKHIIPENKDKILVFCHDDCIIEDALFKNKLNEAIKEFDVIGLAGIKAPITLKKPCLWHLMGDRSQWSGAVAHFTHGGSKRVMTSFGPTPERVVLLDGVFLAINTERILEKGLKFDENNPAGFHFYDLNFSLDANKLGLKLGTWPIWVTHNSHGLENPSEEWERGQFYFLQKYI